MAERRKIIIPTGANPDEPLSTPHFDREATMTARPVVPLPEQEAFQTPYNNHARRATKSFWKRPGVIVLIVLAAVGLGVAAGLAIGVYRNRTAPVTPGIAVGTDGNTISASQTPAPTPTPQARASVPEAPVETPVAPSVEETNRKTRDERKDDDEKQAVPPVDRPKKIDKADDDADEVADEKEAERERKREEKRERRRREREEEDADPVRHIERKGREIRREVGNRIQEIFQGPPL